MFVLLARVIMIIIAISALRSVIAWVLKLFASAAAPASGTRAETRTPPQPAAAATVLEQDPVCGTYVSVDSSLKKIVKGTVYHFCSDKCKDQFTA